jgi:monoamine oxidase
MDEQFKMLADLAATIVDPFEPWTNRNAEALDAIPLARWIDEAKCGKRCKRAMSVMFYADNGVPTSAQSLLAVLAMVKGGGLDRYWTDTELFRCIGGNQQLAEHFKNSLNKGKDKPIVHLNSPVEKVERFESRIRLFIKDPITGRQAFDEADDVILAVPPSVWNTIKFDAFPELAEKLAKPPQMGANVKYLMKFHRRFWRDFASSPTLSEDGPVDLTWETTETDDDGDFVMVSFSGSIDAKECGAWSEGERKGKYVDAMRSPYPGIGEQIRDDRFMNWPEEKWTKASYYFPGLNEVTNWGPFWKAGYKDWLHFAGEHTSYAFMGYMEGALSSGYRLARSLAVRDKILSA